MTRRHKKKYCGKKTCFILAYVNNKQTASAKRERLKRAFFNFVYDNLSNKTEAFFLLLSNDAAAIL